MSHQTALLILVCYQRYVHCPPRPSCSLLTDLASREQRQLRLLHEAAVTSPQQSEQLMYTCEPELNLFDQMPGFQRNYQ